MIDERRDPRAQGADLMAATLAALGGSLVATPEKVFAIAGAPLASEQADLFARMLGLRDLALAYLLFRQESARGRRIVLLTIGGMTAIETALFIALSGSMSLRAELLLTGSTAIAAVAAGLCATSDAEATAAGAELLTAGYALAAPPSLALFPIVREGYARPFAAYVAGATLVGAGWLLRRNVPAGVINLLAAAGGVAGWLFARRRARLQR